MTPTTFIRVGSLVFVFFLLLAITACNAENDHWIVVNILNQSRTSEAVSDTANVCNCASPEQKTVSCSAGTTKDLSVQVGMPINWALVQIDPGVAASIGLNKQSGESLQLPIPQNGYCSQYGLVTQYEIVKGQAQVRSTTSGQEAKPEFTFHATCKMNIVSTQTVLCPVAPTVIEPSPAPRIIPSPSPQVRQQPTSASEPKVILLGQDGLDYAVAGCAGGSLPLGNLGTPDNHIRISNVNNLDRLAKVDISIPGTSHHWQYPCMYPTWQIAVKRVGQDQLDLYFEPVHSNPITVLFSIALRFSDETTRQFEVSGSSGHCCY